MPIRSEEINCLICDSTEYDNLYNNVPDRFSIKDLFIVIRCKGCGFTFLSPRPVADEMAKFYDLTEYQPHNLSESSLFDRMYKYIRSRNSVNKRKLIQNYTKSGNILDIGCGTGDFLVEMQSADWSVKGMETAAEARKIAITKDLEISDELWKAEGLFDVITMWHVLEHIHRIENLFENIKRLLKPGGYLILAVPNINSLDAQYYKNAWVALDAPRHLYHFRPGDISDLLEKNGLEIDKISSLLYFDPWYNALLSAKLKSELNGKSIARYILGALAVGKISFFNGLINSSKCSSPVFIAKRTI